MSENDNTPDNTELADIQAYFSSITQLPQTLPYNDYVTITDVSLFVKSHISYIVNNPTKISFKPYLERLKVLKDKLKAMKEKAPKKGRKMAIKQIDIFE